MGLSDEQYEKAKRRFEEDCGNVDQDDVNYAAKKGKSKLDQLDARVTPSLQKLWEDVKTMVQLLQDYISGTYREVPWNIIAAVAAAIIYFASPIDIIPNVIPVAGYLDDAAVIAICLEFVRSYLEKCRSAKATVADHDVTSDT